MMDQSAIEMRLKFMEDDLRMWKSGYLAPTEPDPKERLLIMTRLAAGIYTLKMVLDRNPGAPV
jgi:hypothetical protein